MPIAVKLALALTCVAALQSGTAKPPVDQKLADIEWQLREVNARLAELTAAFNRYQDAHNKEVATATARLSDLMVTLNSQVETSNKLMRDLYGRLEDAQRNRTSDAVEREDARANQFDRSIVLLIVSALVTTVMGATAGAVAMRRAMRNGRNGGIR